MSPVIKELIEALKDLYSGEPKDLHAPHFSGNEKKYLNNCIDSTYVSYVGEYVLKFEKKLCDFTGSKRAVVFSNGTSALQIALKVAGVHPNDEILIPSLTFVATANAVSHLGAIPHFIDSREHDLGIDPSKLQEWLAEICVQKDSHFVNKHTNRVIRGIVPMHTFGHPSAMEELKKIASDYNLLVIEDAAEALGSYLNGTHVGNFGTAGILSFNGNKIITTGGGGAILTNDDDFADQARHISTTAKQYHRWEFIHDEVGYNLRMPNINAALGCAQMEQIDSFLQKKRNIYSSYQKAISNINGIRLFSEAENCVSNYWLQTIILDNSLHDQRDLILEKTNSIGISTRPIWMPLHLQKPYINCPSSDLEQTNQLYKRIINLPSGVDAL